MSDNKKYYYIKIKDNYFDQDSVKIMESKENGYIYSLIILKLYLKSCKHNGQLLMSNDIPYDPENISTLAYVINHDVAHLKEAIRMAVELDLITIIDGREIWCTNIQNFIGTSSTEADRIRNYRKSLDMKKNGIMYKCTPELEIDIEKEKDINKELSEQIPSTSYSQEKQIDLSDNLSTRITECIDYWNSLSADHQCIPKYKYSVFTMRDREGIMRALGVNTVEDAKIAMDNYVAIFEDQRHYKAFPTNYTFEGFIRTGIDQYCESANPHLRCSLDGKDPRIKRQYTSSIWDDQL